MRRFGPLFALGGLLAACGGTSDLSGEYTVALTNGANACNFESWTEGRQLTGVAFTVSQDDTAVTGQVGGAAGLYLGTIAGTTMFSGTIDGADFDMKLVGVRSRTEGDCRYTIDVTANGSIEGDAISGQLTYAPRTSGTGCLVDNCQNQQSFVGARAPSG